MSRKASWKCWASPRASVLLPEAAGPSTAMTRRGAQASASSGAIDAPSPFIKRGKTREAGLDRLGTFDLDRFGRQPAQNQKAHGDAVVQLGVDGDSACRRSAPVNDQIVALDLDRDAACGEPVGHGGQAVALLDPQLGKAAHDGGAPRQGGRHGQDRILVDHRRRALGRHFDAAQLPALHDEIAYGLAAGAALALDRNAGAHLAPTWCTAPCAEG